ncbi:MAG: hypothetical protein WDN24_06715 [Sphingomonas sp.]
MAALAALALLAGRGAPGPRPESAASGVSLAVSIGGIALAASVGRSGASFRIGGDPAR